MLQTRSQPLCSGSTPSSSGSHIGQCRIAHRPAPDKIARGQIPSRSLADQIHQRAFQPSSAGSIDQLTLSLQPATKPAAEDYHRFRNRYAINIPSKMTDDILFKPVCTVDKGRYVYVQVVSSEGASVEVRNPSGVVTVSAAKTVEVAPAVCLLLQNTTLRTRGLSRKKLGGHHATIVDRLLGLNGVVATRDVGELLDGIVPRDQAPNASDTCEWTDPERRNSACRSPFDMLSTSDTTWTVTAPFPRTCACLWANRSGTSLPFL
jgi:hypothetical protein